MSKNVLIVGGCGFIGHNLAVFLKKKKFNVTILDSLSVNNYLSLKKSNKMINEKNLSKYLQTKNIPDPDLLIRTGNTQRLSNFLLWQLAYAEIFFEKKLWPDFSEKDYNKIIKKFKNIKRNFGKI